VELDFTKLDGLIPAVIQDHSTREVLMLGFMNAEALEHTRRTGEVHFYSRTRKRLWKKGETSGHVLRVRQLLFDCDSDSLLIRVDPVGPGVCHEGYRSCFFRELAPDGTTHVIAERAFTVEDVYGKKGAE
jgi:phosphoribosyl-AMP cyclohydrolase